MEAEFAPDELALELKELGFDEPCFNYYDGDKNKNSINLGNGYVTKYMVSDNFVTAPTFSQAFRWFREKYKLLHSIHGIHSIEPFELDCQILNISNGSSYHLKYSGDDYEQAELECLRKLIQIVKEQK